MQFSLINSKIDNQFFLGVRKLLSIYNHPTVKIYSIFT